MHTARASREARLKGYGQGPLQAAALAYPRRCGRGEGSVGLSDQPAGQNLTTAGGCPLTGRRQLRGLRREEVASLRMSASSPTSALSAGARPVSRTASSNPRRRAAARQDAPADNAPEGYRYLRSTKALCRKMGVPGTNVSLLGAIQAHPPDGASRRRIRDHRPSTPEGPAFQLPAVRCRTCGGGCNGRVRGVGTPWRHSKGSDAATQRRVRLRKGAPKRTRSITPPPGQRALLRQ
jgi:hypothetical protein